MTPADDLLARLEGVTEQSRELDAVIAVAVFDEPSSPNDMVYAKITERGDGCAEGTYWRKSRSGMSLRTAPHYTTSIDAAMSLVPKGMEFEITTLYGPARVAMGLNVNDAGPWYSERFDGNIALAIVTAAIRARAEQE